VLRPYHEKISGRIAVSELARRWQVEALGSDAVEIPNGVDVAAFARAPMLPGYRRSGGTVLFLGRYDEPRKGMAVLLGALPDLVRRHPLIEILIVGRGDEDRLRREAGPLAAHLRFLGQVSDEEKASAMRSADVYVAPNLGGESFGIILIEAMAAGTAVVASELDAFRRVLRDGAAGMLVPVGDSARLATALDTLLADEVRREALVHTANQVVGEYDWPVVAEQILRVYETVTVGDTRVRAAG
jgi:phosphatidylinositol alpha-mannosyltransferase